MVGAIGGQGDVHRRARDPVAHEIIDPLTLEKGVVGAIVIDDAQAELATSQNEDTCEDCQRIWPDDGDRKGRNDQPPIPDKRRQRAKIRLLAQLAKLILCQRFG